MDWAYEIFRFTFPLLAFLSGSIPYSLLIARAWAGIDIREHGSGNPGASNVIRVVGPVPGGLAFLCDAGKGALPVWLAGLVTASMEPEPAIWYSLLTGFLAGAGHIWSPFLNFKGGKGVATFAGVFAVLFPPGMLMALGVFALVVAVFRVFSLGSILGSLTLPVAYFIFTEEPFSAARLPLLGVCVLVALLILIRHTDNLKRLLRGEEHGLLKDSAEPGG